MVMNTFHNRMENTWEKAAKNLSHYKPFLFVNSKPILLFPGLVSDQITYIVEIIPLNFNVVG